MTTTKTDKKGRVFIYMRWLLVWKRRKWTLEQSVKVPMPGVWLNGLRSFVSPTGGFGLSHPIASVVKTWALSK
jgi:hypothetical protein